MRPAKTRPRHTYIMFLKIILMEVRWWLWAYNLTNINNTVFYLSKNKFKNDTCRAQPSVAFIHWLHLTKLNPVLRIGVIAHVVERRNDDLACWTKLDRARWTPLFFFQQWLLVGIRLYRWKPTVIMIEEWRIK